MFQGGSLSVGGGIRTQNPQKNVLYYFGHHITMGKESAGEESEKVKAGPEKDRQQREGHRGRHGVGGSSSEAQYHLYQVFNKTKYETGACGMKSVL